MFLAWLPDAEREPLLAGELEGFTDRTITDRAELERELAEIRRLGYGTCFGELSAIDGRPRSADVVALKSGLLASLPAADFRALLQQEWTVNERVLLRLTDLARGMIDRVEGLSERIYPGDPGFLAAHRNFSRPAHRGSTRPSPSSSSSSTVPSGAGTSLSSQES